MSNGKRQSSSRAGKAIAQDSALYPRHMYQPDSNGNGNVNIFITIHTEHPMIAPVFFYSSPQHSSIIAGSSGSTQNKTTHPTISNKC